MTDDEADQIQACFPRRLIIAEKANRDCSHPVLAVLNSYANDDAQQQISRLNSLMVRTMTIGDASHAPLRANHNCLLLDGNREAYRIASNHKADPTLRARAIQGSYTPHCVKGAQMCDFAADTAFAVHSMYDVNMTQLATIFQRHSLSRLISYMYISTRLYDVDLHDPYPFFKVDIKSDYAVFSMSDDSIPYVHSLETWKSWALTTVVRTKFYNLIFEHVRTYGPLHVVVVQRVENPTGSLGLFYSKLDVARSVPLSKIFNGAYRVPDMFYALNNKFLYSQEHTPHFIVPANVVVALIAYANRASDEGYKYHELATYGSGLRRNIIIGGVTYQTKWDCDSNEYNHVIFSLFILGAIQRTERTAGISSIFKHLKSTGMQTSFLGDLCRRLHRWFHTEKNSDINALGDYVWEFKAVPISDINVSGVQRVVLDPELDSQVSNNYNPPEFYEDSLSTISEASEPEDDPPIPLSADTVSVEAETAIIEEINVEQPTTTEFFDTKPADDKNITAESSNNNVNQPSTTGILSAESADDKSISTESSEINLNSSINRSSPALIIPAKFKPGHCALQAFWNTFPLHTKPRVPLFIRACYDILMHHAGSTYTIFDVNNYILNGAYDSNCSAEIIPLLALQYRTNVCIHTPNGDIECLYGNQKDFVHEIIYANRHYQYKSLQGGAVDKFPSLIEQLDLEGTSLLDISSAPGFFAVLAQKAGAQVTRCHYKPGAKMTQTRADIVYSRTFDLTDMLERNGALFDIVFNDAARAVNSEMLISELCDATLPFIKVGGSLLCKTFANPHHLWELASIFNTIDLVYESYECSERYFLLTGYKCGSTSFEYCYDLWNREVTDHVIPTPNNIKRFINDYFNGEFKKYRPTDLVHRPTIHIRALTGFASAAKTTRSRELFPSAVYISPTKVLALKHQRMGVASFTPHMFFSEKHADVKHIIVDEISQFPADYISLLGLVYPKHVIVVLGDIMQTPYNNYNSNTAYKTLRDYGIINNIIDVYKIPQDVTKILNDKHHFRIRTQSPVTHGLITFKGDILEFVNSKIPILTFNAASCERLKEAGCNSYTITTYTGSRDHTVVFYIDSAAIESQLANRSSYMYTAMSRATNQIVIAGDTNYISNYYNIHGSKIMSYEEISGVYQFHRIEQGSDGSIAVTVPISVVSPPVTKDLALTILHNAITPLNDPMSEALSINKAEIAPVESGTFRTPMDAVMPIEEVTKGYKMSDIRLAKHQVSSSKLEAVQTLIKRYARKYKVPMNKSNFQFAYTELMNGLCTAIYGNPHSVRRLKHDMSCTPEYISERGAQYLRALQKKVSNNPAALKDIEEGFDELNESLSFFNKRQSKFDAKVGFDSSDKVGQGVAATSKRINLIFGAYARTILDRMREILARVRPNVILATHDSEHNLNDHFVAMSAHYGAPFTNWSCNDFSEWDASFRSPFVEITLTLMKYVGAPLELIKWFRMYRSDWSMKYQHEYGTSVLKGHEKQFSGNPFTICENTIGNMALCHALFQYDNPKLLMFKGDDSAVACDRCTMTEKGKRLIGITGHGLKLHNSAVGEFAGWFLTPNGLFPDVLRYSAKFCDKLYRDQDHFNEALLSLQERCSAVKTQEQLFQGIAMIHLYYKGILGDQCPTPGDFESLYSFLVNSRSIRFDELKPVTLPLKHL